MHSGVLFGPNESGNLAPEHAPRGPLDAREDEVFNSVVDLVLYMSDFLRPPLMRG